jgi:hypothetical protein
MSTIYTHAQDKPIFWLTLDHIETERTEVIMERGETFLPKEKIVSIYDKVSGEKSEIFGKYYESVSGVDGKALLLDGLSSYIEVMNNRVPVFSDDFSIEAWIAMGAYPTHLCPIVDNKIDVNIGYHNGYSFNIDALGRLSLKVATNGQTEELRAPETISINSWNHVVAVYSSIDGMKIYLNGKMVASKKISSPFTPAVGVTMDESVSNLSLLIGKSRSKSKPYGTMRPYGTKDMYSYYDGLLDEIKIYDIPLSSTTIASKYEKGNDNLVVALPDRTLPSGPKGTSKFGAINTTLKYYPAWDAPWHVGDNADLVVRFDQSSCKFVFWRGANYIPNFVTENDIWFNNAFNEGWNEHGSCEPMSDKRNTYSHVKIIENNDARVVVLWRYGLVDNWNKFAFEDPATGWGDWVEETYYMYPDMTGIRKDVLYSNAPRAAHEWQEDIMVLSPGQTPEDILEYGALTMANMSGESKTYSWEHEVPPMLPGEPKNANIKKINTKSSYQPFSVIRPEDEPSFDIYAGEIRRDVSVFPWWNHWPVATKPTDGRYAHFADRPAHSSLSHWHWQAYETTDKSVTKLMMVGMTNKEISELLIIARSWTDAPKVVAKSGVIEEAIYDQSEKAYQLALSTPGQNLNFEIMASKTSPLHNPALVISNWGNSEISLTVNGEKLDRGRSFRYGFRYGLKGTDLIIWIQMESDSTNEFTIKKVRNGSSNSDSGL